MELKPGGQLGPYRIEAPIGAGGMGAVWKARDTRLDRTVAVKTIEGRFNERFEREAKTIASLNHPHICTLFDVGENYLVMEYIEGAPLKGPLPVSEVVRLGAQIADALDAAHRKGITHRDLKPANVLVTKAGAKVIDFGLAKSGPIVRGETDVTLTRPLTSEGTILGTVPYMSPEQLHGQEADARSDIFALGCVLYEMLTGKRAFDGNSPVSIMAAILEHEPAPLSETVVPQWLDRVIRRCLRKNPDDRWQSARDVAIELRDTHPEPGTHVAKSRAWLPWAVAGLCAAAAAAVWIARPARPKTPPALTYRIEVYPPEGTTFGDMSPGSYNISPDGQTLVLVALDKQGVGRLYLRSLRDGVYRVLPGTEGARYPHWSPDSRWIAYRTGPTLHKVATGGGAPQRLAEVGGGSGGSWGGNGVLLFGKNSQLWRVNEPGGEVSPAFPGSSEQQPRGSPWFLPDGRRFLYSTSTDRRSGLALGTIGSAAPKTVVLETVLRGPIDGIYAPGNESQGYLLYVSSGQLFAHPFDAERERYTGDAIPILDEAPAGPALSVSWNGTLAVRRTGLGKRQMKWLDRGGQVVSTLGEPGILASPAIAPDGKRIAYTHGTGDDLDIWVMDSERGVASRLTTSPEQERGSVWSPDGRQIAYLRGENVIRHSLNGAEEVTVARVCARLDAWLADGQGFLCYGSPGIRHLAPDGAKEILISTGNFRESQTQVKPHGQWFALTSTELGREEVFIRPLPPELGGPPGAAKVRVSTAGGSCPRWRGDGREIFYLASDSQLMAVPIEASAAGVRVGQAKALFRMRSPRISPNTFPYDAHPDGQRFIVMEPLLEQSTVPITVIVNWPGLLQSQERVRE